jgi:hypothetical protein
LATAVRIVKYFTFVGHNKVHSRVTELYRKKVAKLTQALHDEVTRPQKQILSFKPAPRLEQVGYKHPERVQDCKHRSQ